VKVFGIFLLALDPAGVLFTEPTDRVSKEDTDLLDVIHTCGKYLGLAETIGHIDFYPNGGTPAQPGCNFDWSGEDCSSRLFLPFPLFFFIFFSRFHKPYS